MKWTNRHLLIFLLLLAGLGLRTFHLDRYGLWYDEKISLLSASGIRETEVIPGGTLTSTWTEQHGWKTLRLATIENTSGNSLLYHAVLRAWIHGFGTSDRAVRLLSVCFGMLLFWPGYLIARRISGSDVVAIIALAFLCFHPLLIEFSREAKGYSMATFFSTMASLLFFQFKDESIKVHNATCYIVCCIAALMCHYFTAYVFVFHGLLLFLWKYSLLHKVGVITFGAVVVVAMLGWYENGGREGLDHMNSRNEKYSLRAMNYSEGDDPFYVPATPSNIVKGWFQVMMPITGNQLQKMGFRIREVGWLLIIPLCLLVLGWRKREPGTKVYYLRWILAIYFVLMTVLAVRSGHCISFQPLYSQFLVPFIAVVLAYSFYSLWKSNARRISLVLATPILVLCLVSSTSSILDFSFVKPARPANEIRELATRTSLSVAGTTIAFREPMEASLFSIYAGSPGVLLSVDTRLQHSAVVTYSNGPPEEFDFVVN